jgi:antitoxin component YwqK of YwqJK toxin-antitoxin module
LYDDGNVSILRERHGENCGKLHWSMQFKNGILDGKCIEYNIKGQYKRMLHYNQGILMNINQ